jgi:dihydroorotate dehydrogenase
MLARAYLRCDGAMPLIGCGGIEDAAGAIAKIEAGATLLQVYTAFAYRGPRLIDEILSGLSEAASANGAPALSHRVGVNATAVAMSG